MPRESTRVSLVALALVAACAPASPLAADDGVAAETRADIAVAMHGVSGRGVTIAILDRGIDYTHPDFRNPDGTTRIKYLLDMTGQQDCLSGVPSVEYSEADINAALFGGPPIAHRDAIGHGTVTTGLAAGNGLTGAGGRYAGLAPDADLIIVKMTSDGVSPHDDQPGEDRFFGCVQEALSWLDARIIELNQPCVALIDSGVQWGPMDGTSAVSRQIDEVFGLDRPGRVYVAAAGDEGGLPTHAAAPFSSTGPTTIHFEKLTDETAYLSMWYTGDLPANINVRFDSGAQSGQVVPGGFASQDGITVYQHNPGEQFYPWQSSGPDRSVWIRIDGNAGPGNIRVRSTVPGEGIVHAYHADIPNIVHFTDHLAPGRLTDFSTTSSALVVGCYVLRDSWTDIDGFLRFETSHGSAGEFWTLSSGGPTRDGRSPGVDICTPGHNSFAAYAPNSDWATYRSNLAFDGGGLYGSHGATSASAPIAVGAVALMLELCPDLTARQVKDILHQTARADQYTGAVPNDDWGYGKIDVAAALDAVAALCSPNACPCDWNHADGLDSQDFFDFLDGFFNGDADFNGADGTDSQDYFDFLECFFTGCP